jgi:hypothetical protein
LFLFFDQDRPNVWREALAIAPRASPVPGDTGMASRRWSTFVSGLVLTLAMASGGPAEAQFVVSGSIPGYSPAGTFGPGYGAGLVSGLSPLPYGSLGGAGYGGLGPTGTFPLPGYGLSIGRRPQTTTSFQSVSQVITTVPGWFGRVHRVHWRH